MDHLSIKMKNLQKGWVGYRGVQYESFYFFRHTFEVIIAESPMGGEDILHE